MQNGQGLNFRTFFMHLQISEQWLYSNILPASKNFIVEFFFAQFTIFPIAGSIEWSSIKYYARTGTLY